jgi:hypothetical protein
VAILAVLVLVFSDQPATQRMRGRRGGARAAPADDQTSSPLVLRGPPPADVLQRQLALPSARPRSGATAAARPSATTRTASDVSRPLAAATVPDRTYDVRLGQDEGVTFFTRMRSSVALLVLLAAVGTTVALAIGAVLVLAGLALRHTLR